MQRISLLAQTPEHLRTLLEGADAYQSRFHIAVAEGVRDFLAGPEVSAEFLERLNGSAAADPWKDGFAVLHVADNIVIGLCSFTGPPDADGAVEIAYGIAPGYQNRGHAREAAQELIAYAVASGLVRTIRAHTLPRHNASTRVLAKCGFTLIGEVTHAEDGAVWRWEMRPQAEVKKLKGFSGSCRITTVREDCVKAKYGFTLIGEATPRRRRAVWRWADELKS